MDSRISFLFCIILWQALGAPAPYAKENEYSECLNGVCQCEDTVNQVYDPNLQKCAYIVGSNCSIDNSVNFARNSAQYTPNKFLCVSHAECNRESLMCQCVEGYAKTEKFLCVKADTFSALISASNNFEDKELSNISYGRYCENNQDCNSTEELICSMLSENSSRSACECKYSTFVYQVGKGCVSTFGMELNEIFSLTQNMKKYRKQRELFLINFPPDKSDSDNNSTSSKEDLGDRNQNPTTESSISNTDVTSPQYQILDRTQYQNQNIFAQFQPNYQNNNPFQNFLNSQSSQQNGNNFQNQSPGSPSPNANSNNIPIVNSPGSQGQQNQLSPQNINNNGQNQQNVNSNSPQAFYPSSNQFQQPFQPVGQYQQPRVSLLSLLFSPLTQLLTAQNHPPSRNMGQPIIIPFKREARAILAFFARVINTFLPVLRTLDYQMSPILTELGNFRYNDNTNNGYNNYPQQNNNQQNTQQGFPAQQNNNAQGFPSQTNNNNPYPAVNPFQVAG